MLWTIHVIYCTVVTSGNCWLKHLRTAAWRKVANKHIIGVNVCVCVCVARKERWKGPLYLGGQDYWPVDVWVESELGFPTVCLSARSHAPWVNNRSVPRLNNQQFYWRQLKGRESKELWVSAFMIHLETSSMCWHLKTDCFASNFHRNHLRAIISCI